MTQYWGGHKILFLLKYFIILKILGGARAPPAPPTLRSLSMQLLYYVLLGVHKCLEISRYKVVKRCI